MGSDVKGRSQRGAIGDRLKEAREWADGPEMSQTALGTQVARYGAEEVTYKTVGKYESGATRIPAAYILAACRVLDASPLWVLAGEGPKRWSELRKGSWLDGARSVSGRVMDALRDALGEELFRGIARDVQGVGQPPEEGPPADIRIEGDDDTG